MLSSLPSERKKGRKRYGIRAPPPRPLTVITTVRMIPSTQLASTPCLTHQTPSPVPGLPGAPTGAHPQQPPCPPQRLPRLCMHATLAFSLPPSEAPPLLHACHSGLFHSNFSAMPPPVPSPSTCHPASALAACHAGARPQQPLRHRPLPPPPTASTPCPHPPPLGLLLLVPPFTLHPALYPPPYPQPLTTMALFHSSLPGPPASLPPALPTPPRNCCPLSPSICSPLTPSSLVTTLRSYHNSLSAASLHTHPLPPLPVAPPPPHHACALPQQPLRHPSTPPSPSTLPHHAGALPQQPFRNASPSPFELALPASPRALRLAWPSLNALPASPKALRLAWPSYLALLLLSPPPPPVPPPCSVHSRRPPALSCDTMRISRYGYVYC